MRAIGTVVVFLVLIATSRAAAPAQRFLAHIPGARESLLRTVSLKFYKTLLISPVDGWVVVRGQLTSGTRVFGARLIHSELGGAYDELALDLAKNLRVIGYPHVELGDIAPTILVHVLIYQIKDAKLALSFAHFDTPGGSQMRYYGCAWMAVQKPNHLWETIDPRNLQPNEPRGPRTYTLAVESPIARSRLPRAIGSAMGLRAR